jgi:regulator of Ty1 transposition protein 103
LPTVRPIHFLTISIAHVYAEIVQQSKIRKKPEFVDAYSPLIAEATTAAYKGSSSDVQQKIRRVIEVWRQRQIFDPQIQEAIEKQVDEVDRTKGSTRKAQLGGSFFAGSSSSVPTDLQPLVPLQTALSKADIHSKPIVTTANEEYSKLTNPANPVPTPPVHAARLATLLKTLANAEGAVAESIKARQSLIQGLEKLLETNKANLEKEEQQRAELASKKNEVGNRKRDVEDAIMRGLSASDGGPSSSAEPPRPDIEELTPPPVESFTPVGSPKLEPGNEPVHSFGPPAVATSTDFGVTAPQPAPGADLLASLTQGRPADDGLNGHGYTHGGTGTYKKRKLGPAQDDEFAAFAADGEMADIDADVTGMLER